ncbi:MAG: IS4 family transposase, partial [Polyangiaceae bacterium]|nr:IS4 family transposase [Polyangiaceae bacterium]
MSKHRTKSSREKSLRRAERVAQRRHRAERQRRKSERPRVDSATIRKFVEGTFGAELHAGTTLSLSNAVVGAVQAGELAIHLIGAGLATAQDGNPKHATKQVDRLLSNAKVDVWDLFDPWVKFVIGSRQEALVAIDWTDYARDGHTTIAASLVTGHGRATPLIWKTVPKAAVTDGARNDFEDELLLRLKQVIPEGVRVTVVADRGFGDTKLYEFLDSESWGFVIRFRECIHVRVRGERKTAGEWVPENGRPKLFRNVEVTSRDRALAGFVAVRDAGMKDAWCLATNRTDLTARELVQMYGRRFTIEETFRDQKNPRFGLGLEGTRIKSP